MNAVSPLLSEDINDLNFSSCAVFSSCFFFILIFDFHIRIFSPLSGHPGYCSYLREWLLSMKNMIGTSIWLEVVDWGFIVGD